MSFYYWLSHLKYVRPIVSGCPHDSRQGQKRKIIGLLLRHLAISPTPLSLVALICLLTIPQICVGVYLITVNSSARFYLK